MVRDRIYIGKSSVRSRNTGGRRGLCAVERCKNVRCEQRGDAR